MVRVLVEACLIEKVPSLMPRHDYSKFKPGRRILEMQQWFELKSGLLRIIERNKALLNNKPEDI